MSDLDQAIAQLRACRLIPEEQVRELCHKARELLIEEGNVVQVTAPVTVRTPADFTAEDITLTPSSRSAATSTASSTT